MERVRVGRPPPLGLEEGEVTREAEGEVGSWAPSRGPNTVRLTGQDTEEGPPDRGAVGSGRVTGYPTSPISIPVHWEVGMPEENTNWMARAGTKVVKSVTKGVVVVVAAVLLLVLLVLPLLPVLVPGLLRMSK